ncbi:hypothetical protein R1flu_006172 [Riccia fluitans]|uniref:Uncharacterized protein n=1 Tax=Riccia fluitans TaxID=41844 RepID=A0ABD1YVH0_9MARC
MPTLPLEFPKLPPVRDSDPQWTTSFRIVGSTSDCGGVSELSQFLNYPVTPGSRISNSPRVLSAELRPSLCAELPLAFCDASLKTLPELDYGSVTEAWESLLRSVLEVKARTEERTDYGSSDQIANKNQIRLKASARSTHLANVRAQLDHFVIGLPDLEDSPRYNSSVPSRQHRGLSGCPCPPSAVTPGAASMIRANGVGPVG